MVKKKGPAWNHWKIISENGTNHPPVECIHCKKKYDRAVYSRMRTHFDKYHSTNQQNTTLTFSVTESSSNTSRTNTPEINRPIKQIKTSGIDNFNDYMSQEEQKTLEFLLDKALFSANVPSSFIDNPNVIQFFQRLQPSFKLPNNKELKEDDCDLYDVKDQNIGDCYYHGIGVRRDYNKAFEWYYKSANNGCADGQNNLGECYYYGKGVARDYDKAFEWYYKSANNGCADGQNNLGECYKDGFGADKDVEKAFEWYSKSANNGCAKGQNSLGECYEHGFGTDKDEEKAFEWYSKSANNGCAYGQNNLGECYYYGKGVARDYYKASEWYSKSFHNGCQNNLGLFYKNAFGTDKDQGKAYMCFAKSIIDVQRVRICYGLGTDKDLEKSYEWFSKIVEGQIDLSL